MKRKYRITNGKPERRCGSEVFSGDIIELEEIPEEPEEKPETLEEKFDVALFEDDFLQAVNRELTVKMAQIAREHFKEHPEEINCVPKESFNSLMSVVDNSILEQEGMVRKENVLRVFDEATKYRSDIHPSTQDKIRKTLKEM